MYKFLHLGACKGYLLWSYEIRQIFTKCFQKLNYFEAILEKYFNFELFLDYFINTCLSSRFIFYIF